ncbi:MAG: hypothetical protein GDA43_11085, partial [Hormoscilla sp. SP5CHS1]|nr:hypothetical protein [Hormoscilla sp. SP5CHS1]
MVSQNPFTVGQPVPPEPFVGRSRLIAKAFNKIFQPGGNLAIWGGSGMGKTSFLEKLKAPQTWQEEGHDPSAAVIVLLNCLDIDPFTASGFWRNILIRMKNKLSGHPELQETLDRLLAKGKNTKDGRGRASSRLSTLPFGTGLATFTASGYWLVSCC